MSLRRRARFAVDDDSLLGLSPRSQQNLSLLKQALQKAEDAARAGSWSGAAGFAQEVLAHAFAAVAPYTGIDPKGEKRADTIAMLRFLQGAAVFPGQTRALATALEELDRGFVWPELQRRAGGTRGGIAPYSEMEIIRLIVTAADLIQPGFSREKMFKHHIRRTKVPLSTLKDYRSQLKRVPSLPPGRSVAIDLGGRNPLAVMRWGRMALKRIRRATDRENAAKSR